MGEAFVTTHPMIQHNFRNYMKMNGALLAKGWLLGLQFHTLLKGGEDCLYFQICRRANEYAKRIQAALDSIGAKPYIVSQSNQLFYELERPIVESLQQAGMFFELDHWIDEETAMVRFCTSWSTKAEEVAALVEAIEAFK